MALAMRLRFFGCELNNMSPQPNDIRAQTSPPIDHASQTYRLFTSVGMFGRLKSLLSERETHASLVSLALVGAGAVLAFVMFTIIARRVGPSEFGHFATWFNIASFFAVAGALGQDTFIGRSWNEYSGASRWDLAHGALRFSGQNTLIGAGLALVAFLILGLILHAEPGLLLAGSLVVVANPLLCLVYQFTRAVLGNLRSDVFYECVWRSAVIAGVFFIASPEHPLSYAAALGMIGLGYVLVTVILLAIVLPRVPKRAWATEPLMQLKTWRERSFKMWLAAVLEASGQYLDVVLVNILLGEVAAGAYFAASRIANIFARISLGFETRVASKLSYFYYRGDRVALERFILSLSKITLLAVAVGLPVLLIAGKFLLPAFAEIYAQQFSTLVVLTIGTALLTLLGSARLILLHTGYEGSYTRIMGTGLLARWALFVVMGPLFGTMGIAIAWSATAVIVGLMINRVCQNQLGLDPSVGALFKSTGVVAGLGQGAALSPTGSEPRRVVLAQTQAEAAGAQEIARVVGKGLTERGYDVHYVFFYRRTDAFDNVPNTFFCASERPRSILAGMKLVWSLWQHFRGLRPAAIMTFQHYGNILGAPVARAAGLSPVIANQNTSRAQMSPWAIRAERFLAQMSVYSWIVANSAHTIGEYAADADALTRRLVQIDHGFEPKAGMKSKAEARTFFNLPPDAILLGCVARLHQDKNLVAAVQLLKSNGNWHLALAGQGAERPVLEALAASLGVSDRLHFAGELSPQNCAEFLRALDVFVFPSRIETFGLAAVEAAQAGIPVVANDLAVLREVLAVDGRPCATFVDTEDQLAFYRAVEAVLTEAASGSELTRCGQLLSTRYSADAMVEGYIRLIGT